MYDEKIHWIRLKVLQRLEQIIYNAADVADKNDTLKIANQTCR